MVLKLHFGIIPEPVVGSLRLLRSVEMTLTPCHSEPVGESCLVIVPNSGKGDRGIYRTSY